MSKIQENKNNQDHEEKLKTCEENSNKRFNSMFQKLDEMEERGINSLNKINQQNKQIKHAIDKLEEVDDEMNQSKKIISNMEDYFPIRFIKSFFN
jgi:hypothetical protein